MYNIRRAKSDEADLLRELEEDSGALFRSAPGFEWIANDASRAADEWRMLIKNEIVWIAEDDASNPQGFLAVRSFDRDLFIVEVSVRFNSQGQGIGRALMNTASDHARALGCRALTLSTFRAVPWNAPAYERLGYCYLGDDMTPLYLKAILDDEENAGLRREHRCAMELVLN